MRQRRGSGRRSGGSTASASNGNGHSFAGDDSGFRVPGSVVRVAVRDFMQYGRTEFRPGPSLNLVLGPNGAGKSSLVLAIALGLGGRPGLFGRAAHLGEYVRTGAERAAVEVEVLGRGDRDGGGNIVVEREFTKDGKTTWRLNGRVTKFKEVDKLMKELKIQVDNLCQFLPQDKVHEFSRMNQKELLCKTVEAVGEPELVESQRRLQDLQKEVSEGSLNQEQRLQRLKELRAKSEALEKEKQTFDRKRKMEERIALLESCRLWRVVAETKEECKRAKTKLDKAASVLRKEEEKIEPVKAKRMALKRIADKSQKTLSQLMMDKKNLVVEAGRACKTVEEIEENLDDFDEEAREIEEAEEKRLEQTRRFEADIEDLERELQESEDDPTLEPEVAKVSRRLDGLNRARAEAEGEIMGARNRMRAANAEKDRLLTEMKEVQDVKRLKYDALRKVGQPRNGSYNANATGEQAFKACAWLNNNRDCFEKRVFAPVMVTVDVENPDDALYVESCVAVRDLVAFSAENVNDVNKLMNKLRQDQGLKVNVVKLDPSDHPDNYETPEMFKQLRDLGFRGVVKDLFRCPSEIKAFLCRHYNLHKTPVFSAKAEKHINDIVNKFRIRVFFVGNTRFDVRGSRYSQQFSTRSARVTHRGLLQHAVNEGTMAQIRRKLLDVDKARNDLEQKMEEFKQEVARCDTESEAGRVELQCLRKRMEAKQAIKTRLNSKRDQMKAFLSRQDNTAAKKRDLAKRKRARGLKVVEEAERVRELVVRLNKKTVELSLERMRNTGAVTLEEQAKRRINDMEDALTEVKEKVDDARDELRTKDAELNAALRSARTTVNSGFSGDTAPRPLLRRFADADLPDGSEACAEAAARLRAEAELLDDVDEGVLREHADAVRSAHDLEEQCRSYEANARGKNAEIEEIKANWLRRINDLVERISNRFSSYFEAMGFAGDVELNCGKHETDFGNYGLDIKVAYRSSQRLERLNAFQQSGGERSVATALYMLALQELTVVPFRCVDEINQGMDAINERRVFELLVKTSCREGSSQYFLLTPKLLPGLEYDENMTVLSVANGPEMCPHTDWDIDVFLLAAGDGGADDGDDDD